MFAKENLYRVFCNTENKWVSCWGNSAPVSCPSNSLHFINDNSISIMQDGKQNESLDIQVNSVNDVMGIQNLDISKSIRIKSILEPVNPGLDFGVIFKPVNSADVFWKSETTGESANLVNRFGNSVQNFYSPGPFSTSSSNYIRAITWTTGTVVAGFYRIAWSMQCNVNSTNAFSVRVALDDIPIQVFNSRGLSANPVDNTSYNFFWYDNLKLGTHDVGIDINVSGAKSFKISNVSVELWRVK